MDTNFTEQELAFRDEVRDFFAQAYDEELQARMARAIPSPVQGLTWHL